MAFQECVIEVAQDQAEAWSEALFDLGALSVSVEDADADTPDEQPLFGEPGLEPKQLAWNRSRVVALFGFAFVPGLARAMPLVNERRVPLIGVYNGADVLRVHPNPYLFTTTASLRDEVATMVRTLVVRSKLPSVAPPCCAVPSTNR